MRIIETSQCDMQSAGASDTTGREGDAREERKEKTQGHSLQRTAARRVCERIGVSNLALLSL